MAGARSAPPTSCSNARCGSSSPRIAPAANGLIAEAAGLYLDYSKQRVTDETLRLLVALADESGAAGAHRRDVPRREDQRHRKPGGAARRAARAAGSVDRRRRRGRRSRRASRPRARWLRFAVRVRDGDVAGPHRQANPQRRQHRHRRLRPGPGDGLRGAAALQRTHPRRSASSPTSMPPTSSEAVRDLDPAETLFIVASKTFTTLETMTNAEAARALAGRGDCTATRRRWRSHFVAVSTNASRR